MKYIHLVASGILIILIALLCIIGVGCNCQSQESASSPSATDFKGKSFIWKVTSETTHVYLLGSIHVASQELYPLDKTIDDAFDSTDYLVVEFNTNNLTQGHAMQLLLEYGTYPQGDGLKKNVPEDLYNKLETQFQEFNMDMSSFDSFRPFVAYNVLSQLILESFGYDSEYGIDLYFMNLADEYNKSILELESPDYQMYLLSSIPDETIIGLMQYDIDNWETEYYLQELFDAWVAGDAVKIETLVFEVLVEEPEMVAPYFEIMVDRRNFEMLEKIKGYLADDKVYFIVVGAGHLVGENGLINLLKNAGYDVEQLDKSG